ncbi:MAG: FAD-dependent oxidoreductase, partial [Candidatus Omnitrophota bacterium]
GKIIVDEYLKTSIENIYAAGDCTGKTMLAHYASYQGTIAAENIAHPDSAKQANNTCIPNCIFTDPEIASVGLSEDEAKSNAIDIKISKFDFMASGMAHIHDETDGFVKIISNNKTDQILGASIIGPKATELIAVLALAVSTHLKTSQIKDTIFAHPTLSESIEEALKH